MHSALFTVAAIYVKIDLNNYTIEMPSRLYHIYHISSDELLIEISGDSVLR